MTQQCDQHTECAKATQEALDSTRSAHKRVDGIEKDIEGIKTDNKILHEMNANIRVLATNYEYQGKKIDAIECDIKDLKQKPAERWEDITRKVIVGIVLAIVGYLIGYFGFK